MFYVVCSYNRVEQLAQKTLKVLKDISPNRIYIFTAPEEFQLYSKAFPDYIVVSGHLGLMNQRNYITNYFPEDTPLVCLDDDVESIYRLCGDSLEPIPSCVLDSVFLECFHELRAAGCRFWGIYPINNSYFMSDTISTDLKFCIGHLWGYFNTKDIILTLDYKEDYERTLLYYNRDKSILRFNYLAAKTKMYQPGGLDKKRIERLEANINSSFNLFVRFPDQVRLNKKKEGEIFLVSKKKCRDQN